MKARPLKRTPVGYSLCAPGEATHVLLSVPGPFPNRILPVRGHYTGREPSWEWNGDTDRPTLNPSILTWSDQARCHSYVRDGRVQFLPDSTHEFARQTVDLLEVEP
ncbi:MAG TPA: DUF6527 family protein [Verrucomicrobiae bacterium]|nr:DUF6527 family protein [Verrucomicrobiae bacterium]